MEQAAHYIDIYCERTHPGLWDEPLNLMTNAAFVIAALAAWRLIGRRGDPLLNALCAILAIIGLGSSLLHAFATTWGAAVDSAAIAAFVLTYLFAVNRRCLNLSAVLAGIGSVLSIPVVVGLSLLVGQQSSFLAGSAAYVGIALLIFAYALLLAMRLPRYASHLAVGGVILCVSIAFRAADDPLCTMWPIGTHWVWHVLNAVMLLWMIRALSQVHVPSIGKGQPNGNQS